MTGAIAALAVLVLAPSAWAAPALTLSTPRVGPGGVVTGTVEAHSGSRCALTAVRGRARQRAAGVEVGEGPVRWRIRVARSAPRGTWLLRVACRGELGSDQARLTVGGRGRGARLFTAQPRVQVVRVGDVPSHGAVTEEAGEPPRRNPMPWGECIWWAYEKRPDIFDRSFLSGQQWDAMNWDDYARGGGFRVDHVPEAGAIAVWESGQLHAGTPGHVAYVESVTGDPAAPQVLISDMNGTLGFGRVGQRLLRLEELGALSYIHP